MGLSDFSLNEKIKVYLNMYDGNLKLFAVVSHKLQKLIFLNGNLIKINT